MKISVTLTCSVKLTLTSVLLITIAACQQQDQLVERQAVATLHSYSFENDIKPVLDNKCLACHSCYDAPCQLKMESSQGVDRGASGLAVYDGTRLKDASPTRLYIDTQTTEGWRQKGFYSVLSAYQDSEDKSVAPLMQQMLEHGHNNPLPEGTRVSADIELGFERKNYCAAPDQFDDYVKKFPNGGMPLAVSGLDDTEYQTLISWLKQGAKIDTSAVVISRREQQQIRQWEDWLNRTDNRTRLIARYLYEHLFLGHLYLTSATSGSASENQPVQFYQLIRSYTASGAAPDIVPTIRPNDDPGKPFFYRLIPVIDTIVHKTHITYRFDDARLQRYQQLFEEPEWQLEVLPDYSFTNRSNPFLVFAAIPAKQRYSFLLDDAMFFVRNFIRGPVCRGQIATNVIRDQFWVMFEDPDFEPYSNDVTYQSQVNQYLGLPGEKTSILEFGSQWLSYQENRNQYLDLRQQAYQKAFPAGALLSHIWDGGGHNENAFLTVFRHHNSASVTQGWKGELPLTTWVMGYPLLERTYYELVAGFDVFGSVSHQAQTRLYFDLIRNGSETNFLRFMPADARSSIYQQWYQSTAMLKARVVYHELDLKTPSQIRYSSDAPKQELLRILLDKYPALTGREDRINRCQTCEQAEKNSHSELVAQAFRKIAALPAEQLAAIKYLPEVSFVRIDLDDDPAVMTSDRPFLVYSLLRNRRHSSVAFILGESLRYQQELDSLTILPAPIGSYPNLIFRINLSDVEQFVVSMNAIDSEKAFDKFVQRWAVGRMSHNFWGVFHGFKDYMQKTRPLEAGIYDMNRYGHW